MKKNHVCYCLIGRWRKLLLTMKLVGILIIAATIVVNAKTFSQDIRLDLQMENVTLKTVLNKIEEKTDYYFFYKNEEIDDQKNISINAKQELLSVVLNDVLKQKELAYVMFDHYILIQKTDEGYFTSAQQLTIKGKVTDSNGTPLPGVNIVEKGTTNGAVTDLDGLYTINISSPNAVLSFSFVGYLSEDMEVLGQSVIDVMLLEDIMSLEEVVVVGYGAMRKRDLTGSVSNVNSNIISNKPVTSLGQALQGRSAGVFVVDNGNPQSNVSLKIRGLGTINNSDPLYVVDGVPMSTGLNTYGASMSGMGLNSINVEDIESIDILKDASATAIYGSRGANGVVIVTTKKGKIGEGKINAKAQYGIAQATNIPKMLNASQYAQLNNEMLSAAGIDTNPLWSNPESLGKGTDWIDIMLNKATTQKYTVSYSGGNKKSNYYVSGSITDYEGIVINDKFKRINFQVNSEHNVKKWLKFGNNITFSFDKITNGTYDLSKVLSSLPTQPIYNEDGTFAGPDGNSLWYGDIRNQYGTTILDKKNNENYNVLGNVFAEISLLDGLIFKTVAGIEAQIIYVTDFTPAYDWKPIAIANSYLNKGTSRSFSYLSDNYFTYKKEIGNHNFNLMSGVSFQWGSNDYFNGSKDTFLKDEINQLSNASTILSLTGSGSQWSIASAMFRANYNFQNRYLLTATIRRDGSSRFGTENRWGTFPSFSAAWRISEEKWFKKNTWISDAKLRAGYGITGNQSIGDYSFASSFNTGVYTFNGNTVSTLVAHQMPNPDVHWEEVNQFNAGADIGLFKNRAQITFDFYDKKTVDMLVPMSVPVSTGYSDEDVPSINAGSVNNKGIEISLFGNIFDKKNFTWTSNFNFSFNKNKIVSLNSSTPTYFGLLEFTGHTRIHKEGYPVGSFFGFVMDGIFQNQEEVDNWAVQIEGGTAPGDVKFKDLDNNGVITDNDRTVIGNPFPDFLFSLSNNLTYKRFDMEIFLQGILGNDVFNANRIYGEGMSVAYNQYASVLNRWTEEGSSNTMPRAIYNDPNQNARSSSRFIEDGSYLRLKNFSLGYSLPNSILQKFGIKEMRIFVSCKNLITLTKYSGFDPEVGYNGNERTLTSETGNDPEVGTIGYDLGVYPVTRNYTIGVVINF